MRLLSLTRRPLSIAIDLSQTIGHQHGPYTTKLTKDQAILYALGIGCSNLESLEEEKELCYTFEYHPLFKPFATNYLTMCHQIDLTKFPGLPAFHPMSLVHGEESLEIHRPLEIGAEYEITETVVDCQDKKSGAVVVIKSEISQSGQICASVLSGMFIKGLGSWKTTDTPSTTPQIKICPDLPRCLPQDTPSESFRFKTQPNQALLYRLANDRNPLHADYEQAREGGFDKPILHGLCTYGIAARALLMGGERSLKQLSGRFTSVVYPSDVLQVNTWEQDKRVDFEVITERDNRRAMQGYAFFN